LHKTTFEYLKPTEDQLAEMAVVRAEFAKFAVVLDRMLPAGADKTYVMRQLRDMAMWANVTLTRLADGSPRLEGDLTIA
jgi:hypothetical protein